MDQVYVSRTWRPVTAKEGEDDERGWLPGDAEACCGEEGG